MTDMTEYRAIVRDRFLDFCRECWATDAFMSEAPDDEDLMRVAAEVIWEGDDDGLSAIVANPTAAIEEYARRPDVLRAIAAAAIKDVRAGRTITPGVNVFKREEWK